MKLPHPFRQELENLRTRKISIFVKNLRRAFQRYSQINGEQCAASSAYYAFFSLFPLILLLVAVSTFFIPDSKRAARRVVTQIEIYTPLQEKDKLVILKTVDGVLRNGWRAGLVGFLALTWSSLRFFQALVIGVNRAWGLPDYHWWHLPLKNLMMVTILVSALFLNILLPPLFKGMQGFISWDLKILVAVSTSLFPALVLFCGLTLFYKFAPRRAAPFRQVWLAALLVTLILTLGHALFGWYLGRFADFNALYGVFGTIMALLFWSYIAGAIVIFGGCLAATNQLLPRPGFPVA
jgi:YihY family inner membrane protein